jgi:hypothetical protein
MATRIQVRRGTSSQWTNANPTPEPGEIGWESNTNKFKIGDGSTAWDDLPYFVDEDTMDSSIGDYIPLTQKSNVSGVAELDASKNIIAPAGIIFEGATIDAYETSLVVTDPTADRTITIPNSTGTLVLADDSGNVSISGNLTVSGTTTTVESTSVVQSLVFEGATADEYETTLTLVDPTADRTITLPNVSGTVITSGNFPALTWGQVKLGGAI